MNLFYIDSDITKCAQFHIDKHVGKMQMEIAQMMTSAVWVSKFAGFAPRKTTSEENELIKAFKKTQSKDMDKRTFTQYFPTHINHPTTVWIRSNKMHYDYALNLVNELNKECVRRGYKSHDSCVVANNLTPPDLPELEWKDPALAMGPELWSSDHIRSYRLFYMLDKGPISSWKNQSKPHWWDDEIALSDVRYTHLSNEEKLKFSKVIFDYLQ